MVLEVVVVVVVNWFTLIEIVNLPEKKVKYSLGQ